MILAFDPTKSPYYKVVIVTRKEVYLNGDGEQAREEDWEEDWEQDLEEDSEEDSDTEQIQIYSSETGKWRICGPPFHGDRIWGLLGGIYWNNAIHWIDYDDDNLPLHSKFGILYHPIVTNIQTPTLDEVIDTSLFKSHGSLLLLMRDYDCCYHVFEMREESSEWSVKYIVDDIVNILPDLYWWSHNYVLCIVLGERGDDSYMVIESHKKIVRYKFVSETVSTLCNFISTPYHWSCIPFIASLAGV